VFDFIMLRDRVEFPRAVEIIAAEQGLASPKQRKNDQDMQWHPIVPAPRDAPRPADQQLSCAMLHEYFGFEDNLLCYVRRIETKGDRRKLFIPLTYGVRMTSQAGTTGHRTHRGRSIGSIRSHTPNLTQ
jgi:hypothetical protein